MKMHEIIIWLRYIENLASSIYLGAAESGAAKEPLKSFLKSLAEDEAWHYHLMGSAAQLISEQDEAPMSSVLVDDQTISQIEAPLLELQEKIKKNNLTEQEIIQAIVASETSEWNDIFLYVIQSCMEISPTFQYIAATIQTHEKKIEDYIANLSQEMQEFLKIKPLQEIWKSKILVVDDESTILRLWERVLEKYGQVTTAVNGQIALDLLTHDFFDVIVTDVDMPVLNGPSFLREAVEKDPRLRAHFILCTGHPIDSVTSLAREHSVPLLEKPISIQLMRAAVEKILSTAFAQPYYSD